MFLIVLKYKVDNGSDMYNNIMIINMIKIQNWINTCYSQIGGESCANKLRQK